MLNDDLDNFTPYNICITQFSPSTEQNDVTELCLLPSYHVCDMQTQLCVRARTMIPFNVVLTAAVVVVVVVLAAVLVVVFCCCCCCCCCCVVVVLLLVVVVCW